MDNRALHSLEFDKILAEIAGFASTEKAKADIMATCPSDDYDECVRLQQETSEAYYAMNKHNIYPSFDSDDVADCLMRAKKLSMLTMAELLKIAKTLRVGRVLRAAITHVSSEKMAIISCMAGGISTQNRLEDDIYRSIISDSEMSDSASSKLAQIRSGIIKANERLRSKLNSYISTPQYQKVLQDNIVTKRGDRYVIPVKSEFRSSISGLVHDQSSSGATVYIEPIIIVEMNNELKTLMADEKNEIERILREFTSRVGMVADEIIGNYNIITKLDVIFSRGEYAIKSKCVAPIFNRRGYINIKKGRHPLINADRVVPISVVLGDKYNILMITGPNTGGKTVSLKMVGLFALMAQSGLYIPAQEDSEMGIFTNVFCDVGDEQSIEQSLSTFSSHISNIVHILNGFDKHSLILLDELGAGTDPEEGAALAISITERIRESGAKAIITTHYSLLKEYSYVTDGVENACMDFNPQTFEPTYNLIIGVPGTSNALQIAERLGLDKDIIAQAKSKMGAERANFEEVLLSADIARRKSQSESERMEKLNNEIANEKRALMQEKNALLMQREKLAASARSEVKRKVQESLEDVNDILDELKTILNNPTDSGYFEAAKLRKQIENLSIETVSDEDVMPDVMSGAAEVGDEVYIKKIHKTATVMQIKKNGDYEVKIGNFTTTVKASAALKVKK